MTEGSCFGFYTGEWKCKEGGCRMTTQCKAFVNSDGLDVAADALGELLDALPIQAYAKVESVRALLDQVVHPEKVATLLVNLKATALQTASNFRAVTKTDPRPTLSANLASQTVNKGPALSAAEERILKGLNLFQGVEDPL